MTNASTVKPGSVIQLDKDFFKVTEAVTHAGGGKMGSMVHFKLRNLATGAVAERRFNPDDKINEIALSRAKMQYLYHENDMFTFMNVETYDQTPISKNVIGPAAEFLKENDVVEVELFEEKPLSVQYPETVELKVTRAGAGIRGQTDSTGKEATLENGMSILVPQFIKEGDRVKVDVETGKYLERVTDREEKGAKFTVEHPSQKPKAKAEFKPEAKPQAK